MSGVPGISISLGRGKITGAVRGGSRAGGIVGMAPVAESSLAVQGSVVVVEREGRILAHRGVQRHGLRGERGGRYRRSFDRRKLQTHGAPLRDVCYALSRLHTGQNTGRS